MSDKVRNRGGDGRVEKVLGKDQKVEMKKEVGLISGISFIVGLMIGSGIFISPKGVLQEVNSIGASLIVWVIGGIVALLGSICYAELGCMLKESGAAYAYLRAGLGNPMGYMFAWISVVALKPSSSAVISLTCADYLLSLFFNDTCGDAPQYLKSAVAIMVIVVVCLVNCYSVRLASRVQVVLSAVKLLVLAFICIGGVVRLAQGHTGHFNDSFSGTETNVGSWAIAIYSSLWAYDGWGNLSTLTEEIKNLNRNLPLSIVIAIPMVMVLYLLTNISYFTTMDAEQLLASPAVAVTWAETVIPQATWIIPLCVAMSTFGAVNGSMFTAGRINYVAARRGHMIEILSMIHVRRITPIPAMILVSSIAILFIVAGDILSLINFFSFTNWIFHSLTLISLLVLRYRKPNLERPIKVPIVLVVLELLFALFLVVAPLVGDPKIQYLYATLFILGGFIFYIPFVHFKLQLPCMAPVTTFLQILMEVAPVSDVPKIEERIVVSEDTEAKTKL